MLTKDLQMCLSTSPIAQRRGQRIAHTQNKQQNNKLQVADRTQQTQRRAHNINSSPISGLQPLWWTPRHGARPHYSLCKTRGTLSNPTRQRDIIQRFSIDTKKTRNHTTWCIYVVGDTFTHEKRSTLTLKKAYGCHFYSDFELKTKNKCIWSRNISTQDWLLRRVFSGSSVEL